MCGIGLTRVMFSFVFQQMGYAPDFVLSLSPFIKDISKRGTAEGYDKNE